MNKGKQITDQTLKGAILGAVTYALAQANVDEAIQASLIPLIAAVLAFVSTLFGDKAVASFISKAAKKDYSDLIKSAEVVIDQIPSLELDPPVKETPVKKAAAKKAPAKKAAPKKK